MAWSQREPCGSGRTDPKGTGLRSVTVRQGEGGDIEPEAVQKEAALKEAEADQGPMASKVPEGIQGAGPCNTPPPVWDQTGAAPLTRSMGNRAASRLILMELELG